MRLLSLGCVPWRKQQWYMTWFNSLEIFMQIFPAEKKVKNILHWYFWHDGGLLYIYIYIYVCVCVCVVCVCVCVCGVCVCVVCVCVCVCVCDVWCVCLFCHNFTHYPKTGTVFGNTLLNTKCVFWFFLNILSEIFLIVRISERDIFVNTHRSSCKVYFSVVRFQKNLNCLVRFSKNTEILNFMKILPVVAEWFRVDGQTDRQICRSQK